MAHVMVRRSPFYDPQFAQFVWARYLRVMRWMMLTTVTLVIGAMAALYRSSGLVPVQFYIVAAIGIGFVMLLTSAVMGLRFLSSGTGHHDEPPEDERRR